MYIRTTNTKSRDKARLYGSYVNVTGELCLTFWYHMHGRDIGTLNVIVRGTKQTTTVWSRNGPSGNRWLKGRVTLIGFGEVWVGVKGNNFLYNIH